MSSIKSVNKTARTLAELQKLLKFSDKTDYLSILESTEISSTCYKEFSSWSSENYTRNCITINDEFELILLCWEKGQQTPIHDHGGEECWVKVIEGSLEEVIYKEEDGDLMSIRTNTLLPDNISYMVDFMGYHALKNTFDGRTVTLHLYAKPIKSCRVFKKKSQTFVRKTMNYSTKLKKTDA